MHRRIKGSEYTKIPGGSHATPAENPDMINFRIDLWLRTYFHDIMEECGPGFSAAPARKPARKKPARKKAAARAGAKKAAAKAR
jgi:hypothetical protein